MEDRIAILNKDGKLIKYISVLQAFKNSPFASMGRVLKKRGVLPQDENFTCDPLHTNSIQYITEDLAKTHSWLHTSDLFLTVRNPNMLLVLNPQKETVTHVVTGPWHLPHHARVLPNGHISIFDNRSQWPHSRIMEYDPENEKIVWAFSQDPDHPSFAPLRSKYRGNQEWLPNGHYLITDSDEGRLVEIDAHQSIVWLYQNPTIISVDQKDYHPFLYQGQWFAASALPFLR